MAASGAVLADTRCRARGGGAWSVAVEQAAHGSALVLQWLALGWAVQWRAPAGEEGWAVAAWCAGAACASCVAWPARARIALCLAAPWVLVWAAWAQSWVAVCAAASITGAAWRPAPHGAGGGGGSLAAIAVAVAMVAAAVVGERIASVDDIAWAALAATGLTLAGRTGAGLAVAAMRPPWRIPPAASIADRGAPCLSDLACVVVMLPMIVLAPSSRLLCGADGVLAAWALPLHVAAMFVPVALWQGSGMAGAEGRRASGTRSAGIAGCALMAVALFAMHGLRGDPVAMVALAVLAGLGWAATVPACLEAPLRPLRAASQSGATAIVMLGLVALGAVAVVGTQHGLGTAAVGAAGALIALAAAGISPPRTGTTGTPGGRFRRGADSRASTGRP